MIRLYRQVGVAKKPRKLPKQTVPRPVEREYARALLIIVKEVHEALAPLLAEMPTLLESAAADRRIDSSRMDAGEGKRIRELADAARERLRASVNPTRLEALAEKFGRRTTDFQRDQLKRQVKAALGVDVLATDRKLGTILEGFVQENVALIKGIPEKIISDVENTISRGMQRGLKPADLAKELKDHFGGDEDRAKRIARDQVGTLYGQINATRQKELGVTRFIWRTVGDDSVRSEHEARDGETYEYDDPPDGELPGEPINCRCYAEPILSDILEGDDE